MADSIKVSDHEKYEPNTPMHLQDGYHMLQQMGTNVELLFGTFPSQEMRYLIVVNTRTGESVKLDFNKA